MEADDLTTASLNDRAYGYDSIGNREMTVNGLLDDLPTTDNWAANALNQYDSVPTPSGGSLSPVYDDDGNMTSGPLPVDQTANATLVWDAENRLVEVTTAGGTVIAYDYDYLSRRISRTVTPDLGTAATTVYLYDGWNLIAEYSGTALEKSYTWGMDLSGSMQGAGGVGGLLAVTIPAGETNAGTYYPTYDGNGNVSEYLDSGGSVAAHYEYDPFGNDITPTTAQGLKQAEFSHRFSTKPLDEETGLYYYGHRYYDPVTGRWPSRDPIGERGGLNLYGFVGNSGVGRFDYLGMSSGNGNPKKEVPCSCPDDIGNFKNITFSLGIETEFDTYYHTTRQNFGNLKDWRIGSVTCWQ
ncbi:MAG: RHS repeat-associated core domain-containing protein [Verrucomicrobiota bacterium JB025]|nr:RHS repeat-associated core domain-containing protein [Verrucomicrobiota bacterium JB025]